MGWTIAIGNAVLDEDYQPAVERIWDMAKLNEIGVPVQFRERENVRYPGYIAWGDFVSVARLDKEMYETEGLRALKPNHVTQLRTAVQKFKEKYPEADAAGDEEIGYNYNLLRLEWLLWWVDRAVTNCERPALEMR